jgi:DNA-binding response OmpR family regulator
MVRKILCIHCAAQAPKSVLQLCEKFADVVEVRECESHLFEAVGLDDWDVLVIFTASNRTFALQACEQIRALKKIDQIIVISHLSDSEFSAECLRRGADDYLVSTQPPVELQARLGAAVRRQHNITIALQQQPTDSPVASEPDARDEVHAPQYQYVGDVRLCPFKREVTVMENVLRLTRTEYQLFQYLTDHIERPCSSVELLNNVLGYSDENYLPSLHSHISRLRRKLKPSKTTNIETIWCYGYRVQTQ